MAARRSSARADDLAQTLASIRRQLRRIPTDQRCRAELFTTLTYVARLYVRREIRRASRASDSRGHPPRRRHRRRAAGHVSAEIVDAARGAGEGRRVMAAWHPGSDAELARAVEAYATGPSISGAQSTTGRDSQTQPISATAAEFRIPGGRFAGPPEGKSGREPHDP